MVGWSYFEVSACIGVGVIGFRVVVFLGKGGDVGRVIVDGCVVRVLYGVFGWGWGVLLVELCVLVLGCVYWEYEVFLVLICIKA